MRSLSSTKYTPIFLVLAFLALVPRICAQTYQITDLGTLPGQTSSTATGINNSGQVVGYSGIRSFIFSNGAMTDLGVPDGGTLDPPYGHVTASGINDSGQVVGVYTAASNHSLQYGFMWANGEISDPFNSAQIGASDGFYLGFQPTAINSSGQVLANYLQGNSTGVPIGRYSFIWTNATTPLIAVSGTALAFNNVPQAIYLYCYYGCNTLIWTSQGTTNIASSGAIFSGGESGAAINDQGQIAGLGNLGNFNHAFLWTNGTFSDLGTIGGVTLPPQNGLLSKAVLMRGEAKYDKVNAGTLHA
jgi:probable HAF family extracellular repeat protein